MIRVFEQLRRAPGTHKAVYVAPMKARQDFSAFEKTCFSVEPGRSLAFVLTLLSLCPHLLQAIVQERSRDWRARFAPLGIRLVELTGDSIDSATEPLLRDADIMCADAQPRC